MEGLKELVDYGIIGLLIVLSIWAVAVALERWIYFRRVDIRHFHTPQEFEIALTRRLVVIGTVAANAPYIGLLGTVLGIMLTFHTMGTSGTMIVIYLILAAQFESFRHPVTVLVSVPPALAGALLALTLSQGTMNIYSEIGLMILIGLVTKNAILIVEFANQLCERGMALRSAVIEASALRLRPIIMTTAATILATLPLALATGAGAAGRRHIGLVVIGGLVLSTALTLYFVPVVYSLLAGRTASSAKRSRGSELADHPQSEAGGHERLPVNT